MAKRKANPDYEFDKPDPSASIKKAINQLSENDPVDDPHTSIDDILHDLEGMSPVVSMMLIAAKSTDMINDNNLEGALKLIDASPNIDHQKRWYLKSIACDGAGEWKMALKCIETADEGLAADKQTFNHKATLLYQLDMIPELGDLCQTWEMFSVNRIDMHLTRGRLAYKGGDMGLAKMIANCIISLEEVLPEPYEILGNISASRKRYRNAIAEYNKALDLDFNTMWFHIKKALTLMDMKRYDAAALACERGLEIRPCHRELLRIKKMCSL